MIKYISLLTVLTILMKLEFPDPNYRKEFLKVEEVNFFREQAILETEVLSLRLRDYRVLEKGEGCVYFLKLLKHHTLKCHWQV